MRTTFEFIFDDATQLFLKTLYFSSYLYLLLDNSMISFYIGNNKQFASNSETDSFRITATS